jgi:hypothetical protein
MRPSGDRIAVNLILPSVIGVTFLILSMTIFDDWYRTEEVPKRVANAIFITGIIMIGAIYGSIVMLVQDFYIHLYILAMIIITSPLVHVIGWGILYLLVSPEVHPFRMICYLAGFIVIAVMMIVEFTVLSIIEHIKECVDNHRRRHHTGYDYIL